MTSCYLTIFRVHPNDRLSSLPNDRLRPLPNDRLLPPQPLLRPAFQVPGIEGIIDFFWERINSAPDAMVSINHAEIRQSLYRGGSEIRIDAHLQGTQLREVWMQIEDELHQMHSVPCSPFSVVLAGRGGVISTLPLSKALPMISASTHCYRATDFKLDLQPDRIDIRTSMTYFLDNNNRIYKIEKRFY
eukprot:gene10933-12155_t